MHFGVFTTLQNRTGPDLLDLWRHVEATGWDIAGSTDDGMVGSTHGEIRERAI